MTRLKEGKNGGRGTVKEMIIGSGEVAVLGPEREMGVRSHLGNEVLRS